MEQVYDDSELYHHGILGQKWGVRRFQNPDGSLTEEGRERYSSGEKKKSAVTKIKEAAHERTVKRAIKTGKGLEKLSDDELNDALNRRTKELNYKRTMDSLNPKKVNKGKQLLADAVERTGRNILYKLGDKLVDKMFEDENDELEDEIREKRNRKTLRDLMSDEEDWETERELSKKGLAKRKADAEYEEATRDLKKAADEFELRTRKRKAEYESGKTENLAKIGIAINDDWKDYTEQIFGDYNRLKGEFGSKVADDFLEKALKDALNMYHRSNPFPSKKGGGGDN